MGLTPPPLINVQKKIGRSGHPLPWSKHPAVVLAVNVENALGPVLVLVHLSSMQGLASGIVEACEDWCHVSISISICIIISISISLSVELTHPVPLNSGCRPCGGHQHLESHRRPSLSN